MIKYQLNLGGVKASAGPMRDAVATASGLAGINFDRVISNCNWQSKHLMQKHHFRP
jgi:hypothetical protein